TLCRTIPENPTSVPTVSINAPLAHLKPTACKTTESIFIRRGMQQNLYTHLNLPKNRQLIRFIEYRVVYAQPNIEIAACGRIVIARPPKEGFSSSDSAAESGMSA